MTVVQTGDVFDRGNSSLALLQKLWSIQETASQSGGELVLLLGNHELMNLQGYTYYVEPSELMSIGGKREWKQLMDPSTGLIGTRLKQQPAVVVRGSGACRTMFVHAGVRLDAATQYKSIQGINEAIIAQIDAGNGPLLDPVVGPLWWRGYALPHKSHLSDEDSCTEISEVLATLGDQATMMAVGHNIIPFMASRCGGTLQMLDVGMSYAYEGRPAAWTCNVKEDSHVQHLESREVRAVYTTGEEEPPELCDACFEKPKIRRERAHIRGDDPHNECQRYCPRRRHDTRKEEFR